MFLGYFFLIPGSWRNQISSGFRMAVQMLSFALFGLLSLILFV